MSVIRHEVEQHIGHRLSVMPEEDGAPGLFCDTCGAYVVEWDDVEPATDRGAVEALRELRAVVMGPGELSAEEYAKRLTVAVARADAIVGGQ